jgi:hypothetical protein
MMRFARNPIVLTGMIVGLAGCGSGEMSEGMPTNTEYKEPVFPEFMKGKNMAPKIIPKAGTPGNAAPQPEAKK